MLRFGLLINACLFFLGCALLFAFGSAGSPCFLDRSLFDCHFSQGGDVSKSSNHKDLL